MIWRITPDAIGYIVAFLEAVLVVAMLGFFWHNLATMIILWFTDRDAYRARERKNRADWDDRDGW